MRLIISPGLDGGDLRFVGPGVDELVASFRTFDQAVETYWGARDALGMLAACLSNTETKGA